MIGSLSIPRTEIRRSRFAGRPSAATVALLRIAGGGGGIAFTRRTRFQLRAIRDTKPGCAILDAAREGPGQRRKPFSPAGRRGPVLRGCRNSGPGGFCLHGPRRFHGRVNPAVQTGGGCSRRRCALLAPPAGRAHRRNVSGGPYRQFLAAQFAVCAAPKVMGFEGASDGRWWGGAARQERAAPKWGPGRHSSRSPTSQNPNLEHFGVLTRFCVTPARGAGAGVEVHALAGILGPKAASFLTFPATPPRCAGGDADSW